MFSNVFPNSEVTIFFHNFLNALQKVIFSVKINSYIVIIYLNQKFLLTCRITKQTKLCEKNIYIFMIFVKTCRGVSGGWAGWAIAHPVFGRIEGAAGQRWRAALLLAPPVLGSY